MEIVNSAVHAKLGKESELHSTNNFITPKLLLHSFASVEFSL